jgi:hypothetical protein
VTVAGGWRGWRPRLAGLALAGPPQQAAAGVSGVREGGVGGRRKGIMGRLGVG